MSADLGNTNDPAALIPGKLSALYELMLALRNYGDVLALAGHGLARIDTSGAWRGQAAEAFRDAYHSQPQRWRSAGDAFHTCAAAVEDYGETLSWARGRAGDAIDLWAAGHHQAAGEVLADARRQVDSAGDSAAAAVARARELAPPQPSFWSRLGSGIDDVAGDAWHAGETLVADGVNALASLSNAAVTHPVDALDMVGGVALASLSGAGEVGGAVLDATGIGVPAGVALDGASALGLSAGAAWAGAGARDLAGHAAGDDHVALMGRHSSRGVPSDGAYSGNVGKISRQLGYKPNQVNDAIHAVKNQRGWRGNGGQKNPDVVVDTDTGEVYPKLPNGQPGSDPIGNVLDHLPEKD